MKFKRMVLVLCALCILAGAEDKKKPELTTEQKLEIRSKQVLVLQQQITTMQQQERLQALQQGLMQSMRDAFDKAGIKAEDYQLDGNLVLTEKPKAEDKTKKDKKNENIHTKTSQ